MNNCRNKWNLFSFHTWIRSAWLLMLSSLMLFSPQLFAAQDPAGCNANNLQLTIQRDKQNALPGEIVTYTVLVSNPESLLGNIGCDTVSNTVVFTCPGPTGLPDGPQTTLATDVDYDAGFPTTAIGQVQCTMPNIQGTAEARVSIEGDLEDNPDGPNTPFDDERGITVTVESCAVEVDKQISCDGGQTWQDAGLQGNGIPNDGANGCSALSSAPIQVRYQVRNAGSATLAECTLGESNAVFGVPAFTSQTILATTTTDFIPGTLVSQCGNALPGEPNTATITCNSCNGTTLVTPLTASDTATLQCLQVALRTDRNVDCGSGPADQTLVTANEDGTNGCQAPLGGDVIFGYQANNNGTAPLFDCVLTDDNVLVSAAPIVVGNLAPGQTIPVPATNNPVECTQELQETEVTLGKVTLACCTVDVASLIDCAEADRVQVFDQSNVTCLNPDLQVTKLCEDTGTNGALATITVQNPGQVALENCVATDTLYAQDPTCPPTGPGTPTPLTPDAPFNLAVGSAPFLLSGNITGLTANACNTVSVTCDVAGTTDQITVTASDVCETPELGCLTRTPGFWGTHPAITQLFLPLQVCGTTIDNTTSGNGNSAIEAMCSVGKDGKILGSQATQLIRQCMAASLNVAASLAEGGNCGSGGSASITEVLGACCDGESICTGDSVEGYDVGSCISKLDAFNNSIDTLSSDIFQSPGKANPSICQQSKNNGVVVNPTP